MAHVHDRPDLRHFLDFIPLCGSCNSWMQTSSYAWRTTPAFSDLSGRADDYYNEGRYLRSIACYRLLACLEVRDTRFEPAVRAIARAFRPARNYLWHGFRPPKGRDDNLLRDPAQIIVRLLEEMKEFLTKITVPSIETCVEVIKACEITVFECHAAAHTTIELSEAGRCKWQNAIQRRTGDYDRAALGQWIMYRAIFRSFKGASFSRAAEHDYRHALELWFDNHERLANGAAVGLQFATLHDDQSAFRKHWDTFMHHGKSASEFNRQTSILLRAEMQLRRGRNFNARRTVDDLLGNHSDERMQSTVYVGGFPMDVGRAVRLIHDLVFLGQLPIRFSRHRGVSARYESAVLSAVNGVLRPIGILA